MNFNFPKLLSDLTEGFVFFVFRYLEAVFVVARFPIRGPRVLAYRNLKNQNNTLNPRVFFLINLIVAFFFVEIASPLIFTNLGAVAASVGTQFKKLQNSELDLLPLVLRSLTVLLSAELMLRLATLMIRRHRQREFTRNTLLFSVGLQPLAVVIAGAYLFQFDLLNGSDRRGYLLIGSSAIIVAACATSSGLIAARMLRPFISSMPAGTQINVPVLTLLCLALLYAEGIALVWRGFADPPSSLEFTELGCRYTEDRRVEVTGLLENKTKERIVLPTEGAVVAFADGQNFKIENVETSSGKESPFLIINDRTLMWIRAKGVLNSASGIKPDICLVHIQRGNRVLADQSSFWQLR